MLDQFEQWLHARRSEENTELVQALRQCDGGRVQALVMVRDDFWLAVSRFMLANRPLQNLAELKALASRVIVHKHEVTEAEMVAQVRRIASRGFARGGRTLAPEQCEEVADFLIAACRRANWPVDLRLFDTSCLSYLQWDAGHSKTHWRDLVSIRVRESVSGFKEEQAVQSREERLASDREIVRDILAQAEEPADQVRLWKDRTGKSQATFYNRKREIESREFDES